MRPYILFIGMLVAAVAFTAAIISLLDSRVADQELRREHNNHQTPKS